jgi:hypothetical protein
VIPVAGDTSPRSTFHWILYHLKAMDYAQRRLEKKISKLLEKHRVRRADEKELRQIILKLNEITKEYENSIRFRQQKIMDFIPETEKTKWAAKVREAENECYERVFLEECESMDVEIEEFKSAADFEP